MGISETGTYVSMMKSTIACVLILVDGMSAGGRERQIVELLKGLKRSGRFRTALAILNRSGQLDCEAIEFAETFLSASREAYFDVTFAFALIRQAKMTGVRLIHTCGWMSDVVGLVTARWLRVPIINASFRGAPPRYPWHHHISRWCAPWADAIVANSQAGLEAYGLAGHPRARVIHNGVDLQRFEGVVAKGIEEMTVCMVANFSRNKDQAVLIQAMPGVQKVFPQAKLLLVGRDAGTLTENLQLVDALNLTSSVGFVTNTSFPEPFIAGSAVCVLATNTDMHGEGISNAILEYMALGKPVIATDCGGNAEVVRHGTTGFLVPGRSLDAIAERVIELLRTPDWACQMGEAGRRRVHQMFSLDRMVTGYEALYDRLIMK